MKKSEGSEPQYYLEDGKLTRRTFIKGVGVVTVASALGFGALAGCTPKMIDASMGAGAKDEDEQLFHALCSVNCSCMCHLVGHVKDGRIQAVTPGELEGREGYKNACLRGIAYSQRLQDETQRIMYPMKRIGERGEGKFERITWEEAMDLVAEKLNETKAKYGPEAAGFYSFTGNLAKLTWEAPTRFAATFGGSAYDIEGIMGDHGASMGMELVFGKQRGGHDTRDYLNSNMVVLWGRNVADTHTIEYRYIIEAKENGAKIVVIDPRMSSSAALADQWIAPHPQTDPALALGMMNVIIKNELHDKDFLAANTCAPYLIKVADGQYLKRGEAFVIWDTVDNAATAPDTQGAKGAITGTYTVDGEVCRPAFEYLIAEASQYPLDVTAEITGLDAEVIDAFAREYAAAKPAGIRMGQGMQRVWNSFSPFRTVATLAAVCGYIGVPGGGASHSGGTDAVRSTPGISVPTFNFANWAETGNPEPILLKSSSIYEQAETQQPHPLDFFWIANSNFINMSPDANRIIDSVLPNISTIVCVDPYWTWTAKYADILLPGQTYWEKWDMFDRSPWIFLGRPAIPTIGESKSDVEIMSMLAKRVGLEKYWDKTDEEWVREFTDSEHPVFEGFDFDAAVEKGYWVLNGAIFEPQIVFENQEYPTQTGKFEFYTESLYQFGEQVPHYSRMLEDPAGELGKKYPLVFIQYHDRLNIHSQHILIDALKEVQPEPMLWINPVDAEARGLVMDDIIHVYNDRGSMKVKAFVTAGIIPGTTALLSGWTPDHTIEGNHQTLTHLTLNPVEEFISETSTAFYDVLVEVEKA